MNPAFTNPDGSINWPAFIVSQENMAGNIFIANQAVTSSTPASVQILPNGSISAAGGGAGLVGASGSLFSNPLILIFAVVVLIVVMKG